jgi:ribosomal-protein-alanine acetyltransferase
VKSLLPGDVGALMAVQAGAPDGAVEWSSGNFINALANSWSGNVGYLCLGLYGGAGQDVPVQASIRTVHDVESRLEHKLGGYIILHVVDDEAEIQNLAVDTPLNGRGGGTALLQESLIRLAFLEVKSVFLEVRASHGRALGLYERVGFKNSGVRRGYYVDTGEDAIVMKCILY